MYLVLSEPCISGPIFSPWASYQIRKIAGYACAGNAGTVFVRRRLQRKTLVSNPGMHHGTCVTHVPWCMSGSLTCGGGENVPGACAPKILRIWQEAHGWVRSWAADIEDMIHQCWWLKVHTIFNMVLWCFNVFQLSDDGYFGIQRCLGMIKYSMDL